MLGPSSVRGTVGEAGDTMLTPWTYLGFHFIGTASVLDYISYGISPTVMTNSASLRQGEYEDVKKSTFDPYVAMRSAYFDNRRKAAEK